MISPGLEHALERLCRVEQLLVAMDFDGTMAPIVAKAEDAQALPETAAAFRTLSTMPGIVTALISGRALASLRAVASPPEETLLIGSHGAETWLGPQTEPLRLSSAQQDRVRSVVDVLRQVCGAHQGTTVEIKPAGAVLHTREADDDVALAAVSAATALLQQLGIAAHEGKRVLEASVLRADKGQGLGRLREASGAEAVLFAGDDTTDENAFKVLGDLDVGVKVGAGPTAAGYRIDSVDGTAELLQTVIRLRKATAAPGT